MSQTHGFLFTTYDDFAGIERAVARIRQTYGPLADSPIVVVSTAEEVAGFGPITAKTANFHLIHFKDAPGNKSNLTYKSRENPMGKYISWRHEFLPPRIMMSMELGLKKMIELGCATALHLHADTYWRASKLQNLIKEIREIVDLDLLMIGDLSRQPEYDAAYLRLVPAGLHFQPEGQLLNLKECERTGYGVSFSRIFDPASGFMSHNFGMIEALFGQYAVFCLTGKNITRYDDSVPEIFRQKVRVRSLRPYHGVFGSGLVNVGPPIKGFAWKARVKAAFRIPRRWFAGDEETLPLIGYWPQ